jgi:selenoprotein W-related protein
LTSRILEQFKQRIAGFELVPAGGGCFEIEVDGTLVYSKLAEGRFPDEQEVIDLLTQRL